jgi:IPT/TIG domain-containing protein
MNLKRGLLGISGALACITAATAPVGAAGAPAAAWDCGPYSYLGSFDALGVGVTDTKNAAYPTTTSPYIVTTSALTFVEVSTTQLQLESTAPDPGWTDVIINTGDPQITVESTNTGGGGGEPANTLRLRTFLTINTNLRIQQNYTVCDLMPAAPTITALSPASGPVAGGQTVTVNGLDFGPGTTATLGGAPITITNLTPTSFTFVTPPSGLSGGTDQLEATDSLGTSPGVRIQLRRAGQLCRSQPLPDPRYTNDRRSTRTRRDQNPAGNRRWQRLPNPASSHCGRAQHH